MTTAFHGLMTELDYSMYIVTTRSGDTLAGCLVGFATQSSIDPPRFLVCLSRRNRTTRVAMQAGQLGVHFVPTHAGALAELFGGQTGDEVDKFGRCAWREGPCGVPVLDDLENWFVGGVLEQLDLGDHVGFLLEPVACAHAAGEPGAAEFTFHRAKRIAPGHEP